jgi:protocatechuate 3,4-dioxygenase beta subunit
MAARRQRDPPGSLADILERSEIVISQLTGCRLNRQATENRMYADHHSPTEPPLHATPGQILGPFWPVGETPNRTGDLTRVVGGCGVAQGQKLHLAGRVLDRNGGPVANARLEIWQANAFGKYRHPSDTNPAPLDPNFIGFAELATGVDGCYKLATIKPGAYPARANILRPPHSHFAVTGRVDRVITQMYFQGEASNAQDPWLNSILQPERLIVALRPIASRPDVQLAVFDIVLSSG